jgi:hypothetical protein
MALSQPAKGWFPKAFTPLQSIAGMMGLRWPIWRKFFIRPSPHVTHFSRVLRAINSSIGQGGRCGSGAIGGGSSHGRRAGIDREHHFTDFSRLWRDVAVTFRICRVFWRTEHKKGLTAEIA